MKEKKPIFGEEQQFIIEKCDYGDYQSEGKPSTWDKQKTTINNSRWCEKKKKLKKVWNISNYKREQRKYVRFHYCFFCFLFFVCFEKWKK